MKLLKALCNIVLLSLFFVIFLIVSVFDNGIDFIHQLGTPKSKRFLKGDEWIWE